MVALREASPDSAVIILTGSVDDRILADVGSARPDGFTPKSSPLRDVFALVRSAAEPGGTLAISHESLATLAASTHADAACDDVGLTARELDVLRHLHQGHNVQRLATMLHMSVHTRRGHVKSILAKLGVHSQLEAVARARELRLLE